MACDIKEFRELSTAAIWFLRDAGVSLGKSPNMSVPYEKFATRHVAADYVEIAKLLPQIEQAFDEWNNRGN